MDVRNCKGCGKLFNYMSGAQLCPECREKLEKKFSSVKDYIGEASAGCGWRYCADRF